MALITELKRLAAFQNPDFYKKQKMRLSTALTPHVISRAEELPRLGAARRLLRRSSPSTAASCRSRSSPGLASICDQSDRDGRVDYGFLPPKSSHAIDHPRAHEARSDAAAVLKRFEQDIFPFIGNKPVKTLTTADFLDCLERMQQRGVIETAHKVKT